MIFGPYSFPRIEKRRNTPGGLLGDHRGRFGKLNKRKPLTDYIYVGGGDRLLNRVDKFDIVLCK